MEFNKIIAISGKPGLYQVISQTKSGLIIESLADQKRFPVSSTQNISLLENIAIFTYEEEVPLLTVFKAMYEKAEGKQAPSHKESGKVLMNYFLEVLPTFDEDRVYVSNIKKIVQWYNILVANNLDFSAVEVSEENTEEV